MANMGLYFNDACFKRKFRWMFRITGITDSSSGAFVLPPSKSARPNLSFKEQEAQHLNETIWFPIKPEWKPITVTLYDIKGNSNPVFDWLKQIYDPERGNWSPAISGADGFKRRATLELLDGAGEIMEKWVYENAYPQAAEFGELDMSSSEVVTIDLTLRYDRAYIEK